MRVHVQYVRRMTVARFKILYMMFMSPFVLKITIGKGIRPNTKLFRELML